MKSFDQFSNENEQSDKKKNQFTILKDEEIILDCLGYSRP